MAFTWPPYVDPALYTYLFNAATAAANAASSLQQLPYPYAGTTTSPPNGSLPPCLPQPLPLSGLYASVGLQRVAAAAAATSNSSSLQLPLGLPPLAAQTTSFVGGLDPLSAMLRAAAGPGSNNVARPLPVIGDSSKSSPHTGHVTGMPCACTSCYCAALMTSSKSIMSAPSGSLFQPFKQEVDRSA